MDYPTEFAKKEPYPEIREAHYDPIAVREIKKNYCSIKSETTAVLQYVYHHFVSNRFAKEISRIFRKIGIVEMTHMDLLAAAMICFGGDPKFFDKSGAALSGGWLNYGKSLKHMLLLNLESEAAAAAGYRKSAKIVKNASLQELFLRLADDEDLHFEILRKLISEKEFWS